MGGDDAGFGSFPWQAYIRIGSSRYATAATATFTVVASLTPSASLCRCGGSLISRRHVVTAGHCVARATPRQVHVTLGDYVINSAVEPLPAYTFGVRRIDVHPYFKFTPQADRFDVSVLTLERTVHFMPHIGKRIDRGFYYCLINVHLLLSSSHLPAREERGFPWQVRLGCWLGRTESRLASASQDAAGRRCACD